MSIAAYQPGSGHMTAGWIVSCLLHGSLLIGALFFLQRIQLAPQPELFTWNVAMVARDPLHALSSPPILQPPAPTGEQAVRTGPPSSSTASVSTEVAQPPRTRAAPEPVRRAVSTPRLIPSRQLARSETVEDVEFERNTSSAATTPSPPTRTPDAVPAHAPGTTPALEPTIPALSSPIEAAHEPTPLAQESRTELAALSPTTLPKSTKPDYAWLAELMAMWVENLEKRYPVSLRAEGIQGKVTLMAVLHEDGRLSDVKVARSSGHEALDRVAIEDVTKGKPIVLSRPLERPQMPVKLSLVYDLKLTH